ncbi:MAG: AraC family transcriptional regulator [Bacteroidetes bacterium]|nr:AraC family transcriptional regulator [Bacteroidota bacterium]
MPHKQSTANYYREKINKVLHHIHTHLDENIDLEQLALMSAISPFHFHRIMRAYLNESLMSYIIRVRLEAAANLLLHSPLSISEIAYTTGYDVPSSFNKAFKKRFGQSPGDFRENYDGHSVIDDLNNDKKMKTTLDLKPVIKTIEPRSVIYVSSIGPYEGKGTELAWKKVCSFAGRKRLYAKGTEFIGVSHDDPKITDPGKLRYDACITINKEVKPEAEVGVRQIPGGRYAVFMHEGPYEQFVNSYDCIYGEWLPDSGEELRDDPCFELYLNSPDETNPEDLRTEIYVPIK